MRVCVGEWVRVCVGEWVRASVCACVLGDVIHGYMEGEVGSGKWSG